MRLGSGAEKADERLLIDDLGVDRVPLPLQLRQPRQNRIQSRFLRVHLQRVALSDSEVGGCGHTEIVSRPP